MSVEAADFYIVGYYEQQSRWKKRWVGDMFWRCFCVEAYSFGLDYVFYCCCWFVFGFCRTRKVSESKKFLCSKELFGQQASKCIDWAFSHTVVSTYYIMLHFSSIFLSSLSLQLSSHCVKGRKSFPLAYSSFPLMPWNQHVFCKHLNKIPAKDSSFYKSNSNASCLGDNIFQPYYTISKESTMRL